MFRSRPLFAATLVSALMGSSAASALTADQVWTAWQEGAAQAGLALAAEGTSNEGGVLKLTNVTVRPSVAQSTDDPTGTIAEVTMTGNADGSVGIAMAPEFSLPFGTFGGLNISQQNLALTARENGGVLTYDYAGDQLSVLADYAAPEGMGGSGKFNFVFSGLNGTYSDTPGANRQIGMVINAASLRYDIETSDPTLGMSSVQTSETADVAMTLNATLPATMRLTEADSAGDVSAMLKDGLAVTLDITQGLTTSSAKETNGFFPYELTSTGQSGMANVAFGQNGLTAKLGGDASQISMTSAMLPVPVTLGMGAVTMDFAMPVAGTEAQDFLYKVSMDSLTVNEEAWALIDPGQTIPRDPAVLQIDASGKGALDLFGMIEADETGGVPPAPSIDSLNITTLNLSMAGAAIAGSGAFTFDNSAGVPVPSGAADLKVDGVNGLMDKLIAIGILPQAEADQARMMMSMFLTPGEGEDSLVTKIEAKDGGIFVNGMQVQ